MSRSAPPSVTSAPDTYIALLIPFAVAGLALVVFLSALSLTVSSGFINSILLYANVVQANRHLLVPTSGTNVLTVFIAWMNLDLGFQSCFYNGMDEYAQTWLQFAFPVYIWFLIGSIILASRHSITLTKLLGSNPIAVLATALLMSYTKVLKIIIAVFASVDLSYPDNKTVRVWLKDANVPYLQSRHLALTVVTTLVLVLFFLPYTLLLLLGHRLYRFTGRKCCGWLLRIKPLLDAYHAPYRISTRYWTGLLLLVRCALYGVFSYSSLGHTDDSLLAIIITFAVIIAWLSVKVYATFYTNALEVVVYLNLIILTAATSSRVNSPWLASVLIGMVFAITVGIIVYHFHVLYTAKSVLWLKLRAKLVSLVKKNPAASETTPLLAPADGHTPRQRPPTRSFVALREPMLTQQE